MDAAIAVALLHFLVRARGEIPDRAVRREVGLELERVRQTRDVVAVQNHPGFRAALALAHLLRAVEVELWIAATCVAHHPCAGVDWKQAAITVWRRTVLTADKLVDTAI